MNDVAKGRVKKKYPRPHQSMRAAAYWTLFWVTCALIFSGLLYLANKKALEFFTGYLIELSLSIDNLFVFYLVFHQLHIPNQYQHRVFSYGIWSAIVMRLGIILLGVWLVMRFHWILYVMGALLLLTGLKMCFMQTKEKDLTESLIIRLMNKMFRVTPRLEQEHFFVRRTGLLYATPLFVALIFIEISDLMFAMDSIPAIFAITTDPFIVWTSNIFAILGLRALYFLLVGLVKQFDLLKYGIACILIFVGAKMVVEPWISIPVGISLSIIVGILLLFSWLSLRKRSL